MGIEKSVLGLVNAHMDVPRIIITDELYIRSIAVVQLYLYSHIFGSNNSA